MKICFVHEEYPKETNFGGIATYQKVMATELVKMGHSVIVICKGIAKDQEYIEDGVLIYRIFTPTTNDSKKDEIAYRKKIAKKLKELQDANKIDIIETPDWSASTVYFEKYRKVPLVVRLHTPLKIWLQYNQNNFGDAKDIILKWENEMLKECDTLTSCSKILKELAYKNYNLKEKEIIVIPNPANLTNFYPDEKEKKENTLLFIGSLEERKGVLVLAEALNQVLKTDPKLKVKLIGKDTIRNSKNISTKLAILEIINKEFHQNIEFVGQIDNEELNKYLNQAILAVFPSLFDNFPYVVLESMATGIHIVGSKYSGMTDMLNDKTSIYETGNSGDLAKKIIQKLKKAQTETISKKNIKRVNEKYNSQKVCTEMLKIYENTIKQYKKKEKTKTQLQEVLNKIIPDEKIIKIKKEKKGVSNHVYRVYTRKNIYIIKHYLYHYNHVLANELYKIYEQNQIPVISPINSEMIKLNHQEYNIFKYKKEQKSKNTPLSYIEYLLTCNRKTTLEETISQKCERYYQYLENNSSPKKDLIGSEEYVKRIYQKIKNHPQLKDCYLNHGDISKTNLLHTKKQDYMIDFDETVVTSPLYDFAVVLVKYKTKENKIDKEIYNTLISIIQKNFQKYQEEDFKAMIQYYLCKILLEKFYLAEIGKIDLESKRQRQDYYQIYINLLREIMEEK